MVSFQKFNNSITKAVSCIKYCQVFSENIQGIRLVIVSIKLSQLVTTSNYSDFAKLHSTIKYNTRQFFSVSLH